MNKYGFVYLWFDAKYKRYYIGSHWGHENDGYICSSMWMRNSYKRRPEDFRRRLLTTNIKDRKETLAIESKWLAKIKNEELGARYYNLRNCIANHWTAVDGKLLTVGEKISASHRANPNWGYWSRGRQQTDETKKKIAKSVSKLMTEEKRLELSNKCSGWSHSKEAKAKIAKRSSTKTHTCIGCKQSFSPGPYAIHMEWLDSTPVDKYRELRQQGLSYRAIAREYNADHKQVKQRIEHG